MSYASKELSVQDSAPVMLYEFVQGSTTWRLTTHGEPFDSAGSTFLPVALVASDNNQEGDVPKDSRTFKIPTTHSLALTFLGYSPDKVTSVTEYRTHRDDAEREVTWKGKVARTPVSGRFMTLECESPFVSLDSEGLAPVISRQCHYALFGLGCNLVAASFAQAVTIVAVNRTSVTVSSGTGLGNLTGGTLVAPDGTIRGIASHETDSTLIVLLREVRSLNTEMVAHPTGFAASVYTGCDKSYATCHSKFNNLGNFPGHFAVPRLNPMGGDSVF